MYLHVSYTGEDETSQVSISDCTLCAYVSVCLSISLSVFVSIGNAFGSDLRKWGYLCIDHFKLLYEFWEIELLPL